MCVISSTCTYIKIVQVPSGAKVRISFENTYFLFKKGGKLQPNNAQHTRNHHVTRPQQKTSQRMPFFYYSATEDLRGYWNPLTGSVNKNIEPCPTTESTPILPPIFTTIIWQIDSPSLFPARRGSASQNVQKPSSAPLRQVHSPYRKHKR